MEVNDEWEQFLSLSNNDDDQYDNQGNQSSQSSQSIQRKYEERYEERYEGQIESKNGTENDYNYKNNNNYNEHDEFMSANLNNEILPEVMPKASPIYISTTTKIAYLNTPIDIYGVFWSIPVIPYVLPQNGIVKKEIKCNSTKIEEVTEIERKISNEVYVKQNIISSINNPTGRIKFKDIRKISIGISKKDIMSYCIKQKSAFYNCFVIIVRMFIKNAFKEFHVKIFNTGKLEIPGIQTDETFNMLLEFIINTLQPYVKEKLEYKANSCETILINSNFYCGFYINREVLHEILKYKYKIQTFYDPCSYPGIQSKFYFDPTIDIQNGLQTNIENDQLNPNLTRVSFKIFRTGSVLISGKCDINVLNITYEFLNKILKAEYSKIYQPNNNMDDDLDADALDIDPDADPDALDIDVHAIVEDISHLSKLHKKKLNQKKKIRKRKITVTI
jgi:hypothetical protein